MGTTTSRAPACFGLGGSGAERVGYAEDMTTFPDELRKWRSRKICGSYRLEENPVWREMITNAIEANASEYPEEEKETIAAEIGPGGQLATVAEAGGGAESGAEGADPLSGSDVEGSGPREFRRAKPKEKPKESSSSGEDESSSSDSD